MSVPRRQGHMGDGTYCDVAGVGEPVILLHGVGLNHKTWQFQVAALSRTYTVVTYDHLGHGRSPNIGPDTRLDQFVEQLVRVMDALGIEAAHVVGFSFGGLVAQKFALMYPQRLKRLVLMSTVYRRNEAERAGVIARLEAARADGPQSIIPLAIERWFSPPFIAGQPEIIGEIERGLRRNDATSFLAAYSLFATEDQLAGQLSAVTCPTLAITGELDTGSTPAMVQRMVADVPDAVGHVVPGGRHMMPVELADEVNAVLLKFLTGRMGKTGAT